jgi:hypothetical protein
MPAGFSSTTAVPARSRRLPRLFGRVLVGLLFATLGVALTPGAAMADAYSPCVAMESNVRVGATSKTQSITCALRPACGESWGQIYDVTWNMVVHSGGITVKSIKIKVTHTRGEDITVGSKQLQGADTSLSLGAWNQVPPNQTSWTKTYNHADKYFPKKSNGFVDFLLHVQSSKDNGCNVGWKKLRYSLKPV